MIRSSLRRAFRGATALLAGNRGLVPAPAAGAQDHVLHGDGTFRATTNASAAAVADVRTGTDNTKFLTSLLLNSALSPLQHTALAGRALGDALFFSGPTINMRAYWPLGTAGSGVGAGDFTLLFPFRMPPAADNASRRGIGGLSSSNTQSDVANGLEVSIESGVGGALRIASGATVLTYNTFRDPRAEQSGVLAIVRSTTGGITAYWNGAALTLSAGDAAAFNATAFADAFLVQGIRSATERFLGRMGPAVLVNYAMSAADVLWHALTNSLPHTMELSRGQAVAAFTSDFSANTSGWIGANGASIAAAGGRMEVTVGAVGSHGVARSTSPYVSGFTDAQLYRLRFKHRLQSGASAGWACGNSTSVASWSIVAILAGATQAGVGSVNFNPGAVDGIVDFIFRWNNTTNGSFWFQNIGSAAGVVELTDISLTPIGPLCLPVLDANMGIRDVTANANHGTRTAGTSYLGPRFDSFPAFKVSHGVGVPNLQFNGGACIDTTKGWVIDTLVVRSTAAVTWSLGNASAGAQYVSGYSLAVGDNYIPHSSLVTRVISGANLWSNSSGPADITIIPILRRTF